MGSPYGALACFPVRGCRLNRPPIAVDEIAAWRDEQSVRDLVAITATRLDLEDLAGWLALFDEHAVYEITAFSPEIRRMMTWWKSERAALEKVVEEIPRHERDPARRLHLLGPISVTLETDRGSAQAPFAIYRTLPDGTTSLYVVGRYEDAVVKRDGAWRYSGHRAVLETRVLDAFTHLPL
jgi:3-phenylpropionate/cinnamic acid dioxygenase small subunit